MKKKIVLLSFFLFILSQISANELKWYSDFSTGYCGYAGASYKGTTSTVNPGQLATTIEQGYRSMGVFHFINHPQKLSKQQNFLLWEALREYDIVNNGVYVVMIAEKNNMLVITAVINDNGCEWYSCGYWGVPGGSY